MPVKTMKAPTACLMFKLSFKKKWLASTMKMIEVSVITVCVA